METLTISSYEHYGFTVNKQKIYTLGSAFYGLYFIVSYPVFYRIDEKIGSNANTNTNTNTNKDTSVSVPKDDNMPYTIYSVVMESMGCGMIVLLLLDFCRLALGVKLIIPGFAICENENLKQCIGL